jgi:hypothetical protein
VVHDEREDFRPALEEEPRRDFEPGLEAFLAVFRLVPLLLAPALRDVLRFVEVLLRAPEDFFFLSAVPCELLLKPEAAPIRTPDTAPAAAPATTRRKAPPVFSPACAAVSTTVSRAVFLFTICYFHCAIHYRPGADKRRPTRPEPPILRLPRVPDRVNLHQ